MLEPVLMDLKTIWKPVGQTGLTTFSFCLPGLFITMEITIIN